MDTTHVTWSPSKRWNKWWLSNLDLDLNDLVRLLLLKVFPPTKFPWTHIWRKKCDSNISLHHPFATHGMFTTYQNLFHLFHDVYLCENPHTARRVRVPRRVQLIILRNSSAFLAKCIGAFCLLFSLHVLFFQIHFQRTPAVAVTGRCREQFASGKWPSTKKMLQCVSENRWKGDKWSCQRRREAGTKCRR